jgi:hypothetical protein
VAILTARLVIRSLLYGSRIHLRLVARLRRGFLEALIDLLCELHKLFRRLFTFLGGSLIFRRLPKRDEQAVVVCAIAPAWDLCNSGNKVLIASSVLANLRLRPVLFWELFLKLLILFIVTDR